MKYNLNFHQSFSPEREALAQLLNLSQEKKGFLSKEDISQCTTIPTGQRSGKVVPHIHYAEAMGLLNVEFKDGTYNLSTTPLGELFNNEDNYFEEQITMWACHYNLASKNSKAIIWGYIFNEVVQQIGTSFSKEILPAIVNKNFLTDINLTPFRSCYFNDRSFSMLNIFFEENGNYIFKPHKIQTTFRYLYGYQLLQSWENILCDRTEITFEDIKEILNFGKPYLWGEREILIVLDLLQDERIIILNRQLNPITVVKQEYSMNLLPKLYSLLI